MTAIRRIERFAITLDDNLFITFARAIHFSDTDNREKSAEQFERGSAIGLVRPVTDRDICRRCDSRDIELYRMRNVARVRVSAG